MRPEFKLWVNTQLRILRESAERYREDLRVLARTNPGLAAKKSEAVATMLRGTLELYGSIPEEGAPEEVYRDMVKETWKRYEAVGIVRPV